MDRVPTVFLTWTRSRPCGVHTTYCLTSYSPLTPSSELETTSTPEVLSPGVGEGQRRDRTHDKSRSNTLPFLDAGSPVLPLFPSVYGVRRLGRTGLQVNPRTGDGWDPGELFKHLNPNPGRTDNASA